MNTIDVSDLPEPFARAVQAVAETFRRQLAMNPPATAQEPRKPTELPVWSLGVTGKLTREEIYDERV